MFFYQMCLIPLKHAELSLWRYQGVHVYHMYKYM